jgi:hypothetical protein
MTCRSLRVPRHTVLNEPKKVLRNANPLVPPPTWLGPLSIANSSSFELIRPVSLTRQSSIASPAFCCGNHNTGLSRRHHFVVSKEQNYFLFPLFLDRACSSGCRLLKEVSVSSPCSKVLHEIIHTNSVGSIRPPLHRPPLPGKYTYLL